MSFLNKMKSRLTGGESASGKEKMTMNFRLALITFLMSAMITPACGDGGSDSPLGDIKKTKSWPTAEDWCVQDCIAICQTECESYLEEDGDVDVDGDSDALEDETGGANGDSDAAETNSAETNSDEVDPAYTNCMNFCKTREAWDDCILKCPEHTCIEVCADEGELPLTCFGRDGAPIDENRSVYEGKTKCGRPN